MARLLALVGGDVIDGRGKHGRADVWLEGDRIAGIHWGGGTSPPEGADIWRVDGLTVVPGLVDMHSHDDVAAADPERIEAKLRQGVTTVVVGVDGLGYAPVAMSRRDEMVRYWRPVNGDPGDLWAESLDAYRRRLTGRLLVHVALTIPHGALRVGVAGFESRRLTATELAAMTRQVEVGLEAGACGLSTGLSYIPAASSDLEELVTVCRPLRHRGLYMSHLRDYWSRMFEAVAEAAELGRRLGIPIHLSHLHLSDPAMFGRAEDLLERLTAIAAEGVALSWDVYPYSAGSSIFHSFLPAWFQEGGPDAIWRRLHDDGCLRRLAADRTLTSKDWSKAVIAGTRSGRHVGRSVAELAQATHADAAQVIVSLLREEELDVSGVIHHSLESDDALLAEGFGAVVGSDGLPYGQRPHPRYAGAFAAFFRRHVRERRTFSAAEAFERMSVRPARLAGLGEQGEVALGRPADLAVVDLAHYTDRSTYEEPLRMAEGVRHVFVAGTPVIESGRMNRQLRPGRVLTAR